MGCGAQTGIGIVLLAAVAASGPAALAQGGCGAAGGPPPGSGAGVCAYLDEALGVSASGAPASAGNPVDLVTGNKYRVEVDFPGAGFAADTLVRHYNSQNRHSGALGAGWSHSFETRLAALRAGGRDTLQVLQGDGRRLVFERVRPGAQRWWTRDPADGELTGPGPERPLAGRVWRRSGGWALHFRSDGRPLTLQRQGATVLRLDHDDQGRLRTVASPGRPPLVFEWYAHPVGRRLAAVTRDGQTVRWEYDSAGQLARTRWPDGRIHRYHYDDPHDPLRLTAVWRESQDGPSASAPQARYAYDAQGRAVRSDETGGETLSFEWTLPDRPGGIGQTRVTDADGRQATYRWTYDRFRHRRQLLDAQGEACASCSPAPRHYRHDVDGRLIAVVTGHGEIEIDRDRLGRPVAGRWRTAASTTAEGDFRIGYAGPGLSDDWAWLEQPSVAPGKVHRIQVERNALGQITGLIERGWAPRPQPTDARDGFPLVRRLTPTVAGLTGVVTATQDPVGSGTLPRNLPWAEAFWRGHPTRLRLADGSVFERGFDDFGRVVWIDAPGLPRQWAFYDAGDRLIEHLPGDGSRLTHHRDADGRRIETWRESPSGRTLIGRYRWTGDRLVEAGNDTVTLLYAYRPDGTLAAVTHQFTEGTARTLRWQVDTTVEGNLLTETLPEGPPVRYLRRSGRVSTVWIGNQRLEVSRLTVPTELEPEALSTVRPGDRLFTAGTLVEASGHRYAPDPHGQRAAKVSRPELAVRHDRRFVHQDWRLRADWGPDQSLRQWIWADDRPVALLQAGSVYTLITDQRKAPVRALDSGGRVVWSARYDRLGAARIEPGAQIDLPLRLPGQFFDAESGLHHNQFRTYDPSRGEYLEADPLGLQPDWTTAADLWRYAGGDPVGHADPWGLARLTYFALTTGTNGRSLGRTQGFDRARWSFMIENIAPVSLHGLHPARPEPAGVGSLLFDPWGNFVSGPAGSALGAGSNGVDAIARAEPSGRDVRAAFSAHYGSSLNTTDRFVVESFDDRRAAALARILAASPDERRACIARALRGLPAFLPSPLGGAITPNESDAGANRLLACKTGTSLPVSYRDDVERWRIERLQAAAELQESPTRSLNDPCAGQSGCPSKTLVIVNDRTYRASFGRTQFTVTTFLGELIRLTARTGGEEAQSVRAAIGLDAPITLDGRTRSLGDALRLANQRVSAVYRQWPDLRKTFGTGLSAEAAQAVWEGLPASRRAQFIRDTGLGMTAFIDILGYVATDKGGLTEEEGRHALAASAARTVYWTDAQGLTAFDAWLTRLYNSRDPYDHVSRVFLRDNLRRVLSAPELAGRFDNPHPPGSQDWLNRQQAIELDIAQRVAVLHNAGRLDLASTPDLVGALAARHTEKGPDWLSKYVAEFTRVDAAGNWDALRCAPGLAAGRALQLADLAASFERANRPGQSGTAPRAGPILRAITQP